jgi:hypothetical protein
MNKIISCVEAKILGLSRYFTGKPCKHGHVGERFVANGTCIECQRIRLGALSETPETKARAAAYRAKNAERLKQINAAYRKENRDRIRAVKLKYRLENPDKIREQRDSHYAKHRTAVLANDMLRYRKARTKVLQRVAAWQKANPHKVNEISRNRDAKKLRATPGWADRKAIDQYYLIASFLSFELGIDFHVDHVVPLQSDMVQGFHSQHNLNISLASWNCSKSNRWWPDMAAA